MVTYIIIAAAAVLLALGIVLYIRHKSFKPNPNKSEQLEELNNDLQPAGFAYNFKEDYFYSLKDCWQRQAGYCRLYDEGSPLFNMEMDCEPITFSYNGKRWLIELWKGQYGITTGAEIGIYNTTREDVHSDKFTGTFYQAIDDNEQLGLSFILYKNGKKLLQRREQHWWLTAFKLGEFSEKSSLTMNAKIKFPNRQMCSAFVQGLIKAGYVSKEFKVRFKTVTIKYTKPHTPQPISQQGVQERLVQETNKSNCNIFKIATAKYSDTMDKLEYIKSFVPELYDFMINSLYGKEFFKAFEWLFKPNHKSKPLEPPHHETPHDCNKICRRVCRLHCERLRQGMSCCGEDIK